MRKLLLRKFAITKKDLVSNELLNFKLTKEFYRIDIGLLI